MNINIAFLVIIGYINFANVRGRQLYKGFFCLGGDSYIMSLLGKYCETYRGLLLFAAYFYVIGTFLSFIRVAILLVIYTLIAIP